MRGFEKYLTHEDILQRECAAYLNHYRIPVLWMHPPNEGRRTKFERFKFLQLGGKAGIPDIMVFEARGGYHGLAVELKVTSSATESQKKWHQELRTRGWRVEVIKNKDIGKGYEQFREIIDAYMMGKLQMEGFRR
jgi:hypothetical protein